MAWRNNYIHPSGFVRYYPIAYKIKSTPMHAPHMDPMVSRACLLEDLASAMDMAFQLREKPTKTGPR
jgi:hypothetical protein